jgi:conjugative relaxase-like TrwC/TraI family protein
MRLGAGGFSGEARVLSVAKLTVGQGAYYERQVAAGVDDYYAGRGESPGIWAGSGSARLGLVGVVEDGDLGTMLRGVNPATDEQLRAPVRKRTITVRTLDVESGEWREEQKRLAPLSGYDLVFSCPKSVSLLHALTEDERLRREISEAHETAWQAALAYLEREACVVRRGRGGKTREGGEGFVAAAFRHRTSRAQEPHLHTHVIVANLARAPDGEWRALDGEAILRTYRLAAGYLYEAQLRNEVTRRLGLEWTEPAKGMGELRDVPEQAIRAFSSRRRSLVEHMEALGTEGFAAARIAALATREVKEQVDLPTLRKDCLARAAEHGPGRHELRGLGRLRPLPSTPLEVEAVAAERLTDKQTTFTMPEVVRAVAGAAGDGATVEDILAAAEQLISSPLVEQLEPQASPGRPARFTTRELLQLEHDALELALHGRDVGAPSADRTLLARMLMESGAGLSGEQRMLVHEASSRPDRVVCVVGAAGTGKTTALRLLADAYRESDIPVLGAAPSGRAADELAAAAGITSSTLHRLLLDAHTRGGLPHGCLLLVDEAGMAETRVLAPLLQLVDRAEGKAILVGDPQQLPPVGAGGLFPALCERLDAISLADNRRQISLSERRALEHLRAGDPEPYLARAARGGRLVVDDDPTVAKQRLLEDWWQVAQYDLSGTVMLAYRRADVRDLNDAARTLLTRAGQLGPETLEAGEREFRVGDRVICRRNDERLGVRNGIRATVLELDETGLTLRSDSGALRSLDTAYACEHLEHAYALTGHAAQGATVERAFVLLPDRGDLREWGYVACSRARTETRLYLAEHELEREQHARPLDDRDPTAHAAGALERPARDELARVQARRERSETTRRLLEQRRADCDRALERAEQRLTVAQQKLNRLGRIGRRRERAALEAEVARQSAAVRLAERHLAALPAEPLRTEAVSRRQEPAGPALARSRERDRGLGLEL